MRTSSLSKFVALGCFLLVSMIALPAVSYADGDAREFRGLFEVSVEGKKSNGSLFRETIKNVSVIRFGRNFVILKTGQTGTCYHQKTIDSITWKSIEAKAIPGSTVVKGTKPLSEAEQSKAIDKLFAEIEDLIDKGEYDGLLLRFQRLEKLMANYGRLKTDISKERLAKWMGKWKDTQFSDVQRALQLQVFVSEGNAILRDMAKNLRDKKNGRVIRAFKEMEKLCAKMKALQDDIYVQNAKALYERAKELNDQAIKNHRNK